jgi:serine/threonine protein kinase/tetratricopeptide (TPR) repeat protein
MDEGLIWHNPGVYPGANRMISASDDSRTDETRAFKVLSPGTGVSHYMITGQIGAGGMGVVYKAEDTKLKRHVALKFLPPHLTQDPEAKERFVREAQAASALDHPNICVIYEIEETDDGQIFIAMACYEGETLKQKLAHGPLGFGEAVDVALQVAGGLAKAHKMGIVHRDIKPANIMITPDGIVKIMDFGLAKLAGQAGVTKIGTAVGTVAYMSPEQAEGQDVDRRADIWSLGVVLYEMLTGRSPFRGDHDHAVIYSILNREPEPLRSLRADVPPGLELVMNRALAKNPDARYHDADELLADLKRAEAEPGAKPQPSIAVLPFTNLSADPEQEYFCDGLAEEIINALTHVDGIKVVARTSSFAFKDKRGDIREIGRKLSVETLLEGSVRKAANRLRISAQLINVTDGYHMWSERYDRDIEDIFAIQDDVSLSIVEHLRASLLGGFRERLVKRRTPNAEVHNLYLKGRYFLNQRSETSVNKSIECFQAAIEKDPQYAEAYAGLADAYLDLADLYYLAPREAYPKAREAALRALEMDPMLAEAQTSLATVLMKYDMDWVGAGKRFKQALKLNPGYAHAHHQYALLLMWHKRFDESIREIGTALELDPLSLYINRDVGQVYMFLGESDKAIEALKKTLEIDPNFTGGHGFLGLVHAREARYQQALEELKKEQQISAGWGGHLKAILAVIHARMGDTAKARELLEQCLRQAEQTYFSHYFLAYAYVAVGEDDKAIELLWKAYEERDSALPYIAVDQTFLEKIKTHPRVKELLTKIGLPH